MLTETIARLTGILDFKINTAGLQQFQNSMSSVSKQMQQLAKQAEALNSKLALKMGIKPADTAAQAAAQKSVIASLDRELKLERLVAQAKRETFKTELAQSKLQFTGNKAPVHTLSNSLQFKQAQAIADAKQYAHKLDLDSIKVQAAQQKLQHASTQASLKVQGLKIKNESVLEAAKARQLRSEKLLQLTQAKTQLLQQKQFQTLTATQKIELVMQHARERSQRLSERFQQQQALSRTREQRQEVKHQQSQQRFKWQQARQQQWEANRNSPRGSNGGFNPLSMVQGLSGGAAGLAAFGGLGAALAALTVAITSLDARLDKRRDSASESEQWATTLEQVGGKNEENQKRARKRFLEISDKYGSSVDLESAQTFRQFMLNQQALGLSLDAAAQKYETQTASFRGAGMTKEQQKRASYQLGQIQSKGKPEGADVNDLFDAAGVLAPYIRQAAADRLNFKGKVEEQAGWFKASVSDGLILAKDFDAGMTQFVKTNADIINKQNKSISANQTRAENDLYIQKQNINSNADMVSSVNERIKAERELTAAMQPVNAALGELDIALMKTQTNLTRAFVDSPIFRTLTDAKLKPGETKASRNVDAYADVVKYTNPTTYAMTKTFEFFKGLMKGPEFKPSQDIPVTQSILGGSPLGGALANTASVPSMTLNPELVRSMSDIRIPDSVMGSVLPSQDWGTYSNVAGSHNIENSNNTVHQQFDIVINAPQNTDVNALSSQLDNKIRTGAQAAILDAFGAARSQQAERK